MFPEPQSSIIPSPLTETLAVVAGVILDLKNVHERDLSHSLGLASASAENCRIQNVRVRRSFPAE